MSKGGGLGFESGRVAKLPNKLSGGFCVVFPLNPNGLTKESVALHRDLLGGPLKKKKNLSVYLL